MSDDSAIFLPSLKWFGENLGEIDAVVSADVYKIGDFWLITRYISKTKQDRTIVTMEYATDMKSHAAYRTSHQCKGMSHIRSKPVVQ